MKTLLVYLLVMNLFMGLGIVVLYRHIQSIQTHHAQAIQLMHKRVRHIEQWHGWPPYGYSLSEGARDHAHN